MKMKKHILAVSMMAFSLFSMTAMASVNDKSGSSLSSEIFQLAYTDSTGLKWSHPLSDIYANGCSFRAACNSEIKDATDSQAEAACEKVGAKLPTIEQVGQLVAGFDHSGSQLTYAGLQQLKLAFANDFDERRDWFWTSTVTMNGPVWNLQMASDYGDYHGVGDSNFRAKYLHVRCVQN